MRYASIVSNDFVNGEGVCVSFFMQGCPHHCKGCFNQETWDPNGGIEKNRDELISELLSLLDKNGVKRNLSILGGEPLAYYNREDVAYILRKIKEVRPETKVYLWTGYLFRNVQEYEAIKYVDVLIEGPFILEERDITLKLRGSRNQNILRLKGGQIVDTSN